MSVTTESTSALSSGPAKARPGFHWTFFLLLILAGLAVLYFAGVFRRAPRIAMITGDSPYWDLVIDGANEAARQYDVKLTVVRSQPDEASQSQAITDLLTKSFDGIAISPIKPEAQSALLSDVAVKTTLVTFDSDSPLSQRLCFVGTDNYSAGRLCGQYVRQAIPDGGEVILSIANLDKENGQRRRQGVIDELLDRHFEPEHPMDPPDAPPLLDKEKSKFIVVTTLIDNADQQAASDLAAKALKDHPQVKCFVGLNAYSTPAILRALESAQRLGQVKVVGFDNDKGTVDGIEVGNVHATIVQDQFGCGFHAVRILAENARGDKSGLPMFNRRPLPVEVVNKENVGRFRGQLGATTQPAM